MFVVTEEWINSFKTKKGGFTKEQVIALDEPWPAVKGWAKRSVGKQIPEEARIAFETASVNKKAAAKILKPRESSGQDARWRKAIRKLARDLLATEGEVRQSAISILATAVPIAERAIGVCASGSANAFLKNHFDELTAYCRKKGSQLYRKKVVTRSAKTFPRMQEWEKQRGVEKFLKYSSIDPRSDEFLKTFEWRAARMLAIKRYGPVCQCCGASPKTGAVIHVDHIKPRRLFPELALEQGNLQVLCQDCNHGKGSWDQTDWRPTASL